MNHLRRLPVYVLLDCSESMIGPGIEGLRLAVADLLAELQNNPQAVETVWLSFITFDAEARQVLPLTPLEDVQPPVLQVRPGTAMGSALRLTTNAIRREVRRTTATEKGDYRPLIFLITDGQATDDWQSALRELDTRSGTRPANCYAIGCGADVDYGQLGKLTDIVLRLDKVDSAGFGQLFVWLSASVHSASMGVADNDPAAAMANLPSDVMKVDISKVPQHDGRPRQLFLRMVCGQLRGYYLMRFRLDEASGMYRAITAHLLETGGPGRSEVEFRMPSVNSDLLLGCAPCPYCGNSGGARCGNCGTLFCAPSRAEQSVLICPSCTARLDGVREGSFEVNQSAG